MRRLLSPLLLLFLAPCIGAADDQFDAVRAQRLVALCKVWGTVRYLHPYLAYKDIDWDKALLEALPRVEAAKDGAGFRAAVADMLDRLGDPRTRVAPVESVKKRSGNDAKDRALFSLVEKDILAVHLDRPPSLEQLMDNTSRKELLAAVAKATRIIVDLRGEDEQGFSAYALSWLNPHLPSRELQPPVERYLVHSGYRPQVGTTSGGYFSAFQAILPEVIQPAPGAKGKRIVFLIAESSTLPPIAFALQAAGDAFIVAQGKVPTTPGGIERIVALREGFAVRVRTTELLGPEGLLKVRPDAEVAVDADRGPAGPAYQKALTLLREGPRAAPPVTSPASGVAVPVGAWRPDQRYETMTYPDRAHRLLTLFRFWNVIHYFYPYQRLLDQDWDTVLPRFLPEFAGAADGRAYALAVAEMAACIQDTHTHVAGSTELNRFFGEAAPPVALRLIEGQPTVTDLLDAATAKKSGVEIGDVVVTVDGEPVAKRMGRLGKFIAGSNPEAHAYSVVRRLLRGPDGVPVKLTVRGRDDLTRDIALPRTTKYASMWPARAGDVFKMLDGQIGYCDLERLTIGQVDAMLERFKDTRAIVFDLRGYPRRTAWTLAPRLNVKGAKYAAAFTRMLVSGDPSPEEGENRQAFLQPMPVTDTWKYKGKTVTLIDERAISQSEHTGLFLEAACATTFIGSPTTGANGDITRLTLPGGLTVGFTGHDVRHVDGRQLQRVGLAPHIAVRPTLAGVRTGRDEVLERALQYLRGGK